MHTVDIDLPCVRCGYNLRTLERDGLCPECGETIASTVATQALRNAPFGRLRALPVQTLSTAAHALMLANVAWFIGLPLTVLMIATANNMRYAIRGTLELLPFVCGYVISAWAAWWLATAGRDRGVLESRFVRGLLLAGIAALGLIFLNGRWVNYYVGRYPSDRFERTLAGFRLIGRLCTVAWPCSTFWATTRLMRLASVAGRRGAAIAFGLTCAMGTIITGMLCFATIADDVDRASSGDMMTFLIGPTGNALTIWFAVAGLIVRPAVGQGEYWILALVTFFTATVMSAALLRLSIALKQAIALGELPAASSRSSPAPRPPA